MRPAAPGAPLAVRRSTPSRPRLAMPARAPERPADPGLPLDSALRRLDGRAGGTSWPTATWRPWAGGLGAAALDWLMLLALDAGVVYFTLRVSRLAPAEVALLPPVPMVAFLLLLNGGYLALFTAATGQTIGKMAVGVRVVPVGEGPLTVGRALVRVVALDRERAAGRARAAARRLRSAGAEVCTIAWRRRGSSARPHPDPVGDVTLT